MTVSLKTYVDTVGAVVVIGLLALLFTLDAGNTKAVGIALDGERLARTVALDRANETAALHNDLIRKGERAAATYVTRGQVYAALATALVVVGLVMTFYANFGGK